SDWTSPSDLDNPMKWPQWKKVWHASSPALCGFVVTIGSSIITPAHVEIQHHFSVSETSSILPLSLYLLGLGFGPVIAAGPSERYGRAVVSKGSMMLFMLFVMGIGFSESLAGVLICRFLAGFFGGPILAVGAGTLTDLYPPHKRAISQTGFVVAPFLGPAIGPVIGGFAAQYKGWRWTQWCTLYIALPIYLVLLPTSETYKKIILQRRAKRHGLPEPKGLGPEGRWLKIKFLMTVTLFRPIMMLLTEPIVSVYSVYVAVNFSILFAFFAAYPYVFQGVYGSNLWQYGLTFLGIGVGVLVAAATGITIDRVVYRKMYRRALQQGKSSVAPEHRLYTAMVGSIGLPIGLFWFGWSAEEGVHWIVPTLAGIFFGWGNLCVFMSNVLYLSDVYGQLNGASAMAANGMLRYTLGAAFPLSTLPMYRNLGIAWATSLLGFISVALLPIPWIFYKWGRLIKS
ncbi:major facilitator superfamily domain-containing protein, partial [Delphinella strobiligena]